MEQSNLNLTKFEKPKKERVKKTDGEPKPFNGFKLLYLINIKRSFRNKGVFWTGLFYLFIVLVMSLVLSPLLADINKMSSIGLIILSIFYIFQTFFLILFMAVLSSALIKKQILDGIQNIETRSGMKFRSSFFLRILVFWTITGSVLLLQIIITVASMSNVINKFDAVSGIVISTLFFSVFLAIFWAPIVMFVTILCSVAWSVILNIFLAGFLTMAGLFMSFTATFSGGGMRNNESIINLNLKINIANSFYNEFKNDDNVKFIFDDTLVETSGTTSKMVRAVNSNPLLESEFTIPQFYYYELNSNIGNNNWGPEEGKEETLIVESTELRNALYAGIPNIQYVKTNSDTGVTSSGYVLQGTEIFKILNEIYSTVLEGMKSETNKPTISKPGYYGGFFQSWVTDQGFHDLNPLIKWISKQESTKKYASLLKWTEEIYSKYGFAITAGREDDYYISSSSQKPYIFASRLTTISSIAESSQNADALKLYKRYPELIILNNIITESWINTMMSRTELKYYGDYGSTSDLKYKEVYSTYQKKANSSMLSLNLNIFKHFSIMYTRLIGNSMNNDLLQKESIMSYSGISTGYSNYEELNKVDLRNYVADTPMSPIFETASLNKNFGFNVKLAYFVYFAFSFLFVYFVYLLWARKSRL